MPVNVHMEIHTDAMYTCRHTEVPIHTDMKTYTHMHIQTDTLDTKRHKHADRQTDRHPQTYRYLFTQYLQTHTDGCTHADLQADTHRLTDK